MSHFSRLSEIVSCNLTSILAKADDPEATLRNVIDEMTEGYAGAERAVAHARKEEDRLASEVEEHKAEVETSLTQAKSQIAAGRDDDARAALFRKKEIEDLLAGLLQQHSSAVATREQYETTRRAIHARLSEARRRLAELDSGTDSTDCALDDRDCEVEAELERLRQELAT